MGRPSMGHGSEDVSRWFSAGVGRVEVMWNRDSDSRSQRGRLAVVLVGGSGERRGREDKEW